MSKKTYKKLDLIWIWWQERIYLYFKVLEEEWRNDPSTVQILLFSSLHTLPLGNYRVFGMGLYDWPKLVQNDKPSKAEKSTNMGKDTQKMFSSSEIEQKIKD